MVAGKRLFLDTEWKKCVALYENNNNVRVGMTWVYRGTVVASMQRKRASCLPLCD